MPSARVLEAAALREGGLQTELQSAAFSHTESTITPSTASTSDVGFDVSAAPSSSARPKSAWAPRPIPQSSANDDHTRSSAAAASASPSASGFVSSSTSTSMSSLTAAFSQVLSQQREEEEAKRVEESVRAVQNGMFAEAAAAGSGGTSTRKNLDAAATVTCFDLVTSTAARVPLAKIIAASNPAQATATIEAAAAKTSATSKSSDTYVVIQPIDWSVHHADCTFARLTAVNQGADAADAILLELSEERNELSVEVEILRKQMSSKDQVIEDQRGQIRQLQEALAKAQKQGGGSVAASPSTAAAPSSSAKSRAPKIHDSESEGSEEDDVEEDQLDEEQGDFQ